MSNKKEKSGGFGKLILWILGIFLAVQVFSDGTLDLFSRTPSEGTDPQGGEQTQPSPTVDRLPSVPDSLKDHILLKQRDRGISATLTGDVLLTVVFVEDPTSVWSAGEMEQAKSELSATFGAIMADAAGFGVELNLTMECRQASVGIAVDREDQAPWVNSALASAGLKDLKSASSALERGYGVKEAPILFYVNTIGRAFAVSTGNGDTEYALFYHNDNAASQYRHELYHIFGAKDYYFPSDLLAIAQKYYPTSTMLHSDSPVTDSLTAYLIGWTDVLSADDLSFLQETAYLTPEYIEEQRKEETYTGYVRNRRESNGVYTGYLENGVQQGRGKMVFDSGVIYEGNWEYGQLRGQAKVQWPEGTAYRGNWEEGNMNGNGTYYFANGTVYDGEFQNGKFHGKGKMTYKDGNVYEGDWENGKRQGQGTMQWADGTVYTGEFQNGKIYGRGTLTYPDGKVLSGTWENGDFVG